MFCLRFRVRKLMDGAPSGELAELELAESRTVGKRDTVGGNRFSEPVAYDVAIEQRKVLRLGLECEYARAAGFRRPDRVHSDVGTDVDQYSALFKSGNPFDRIR